MVRLRKSDCENQTAKQLILYPILPNAKTKNGSLRRSRIAQSIDRLKLAKPSWGIFVAARLCRIAINAIALVIRRFFLSDGALYRFVPTRDRGIVRNCSTQPKIWGKMKSLAGRQTLPVLLRPHTPMCRTVKYSKLT